MNHAMAFDSVRNVTVMFGGLTDQGVNRETWEWNGSRWELRASDGPPARHYHAMAFDEARGRVVLFSGTSSEAAGNPAGLLGDTWEWDGDTWTQRLPVQSPSPRVSHAMAYDNVSGRVLMYGGSTTLSVPAELWSWNGSNWTVVQAGNGPDGREWPALAFDRARGALVLFGGQHYTQGIKGDTWEWRPEGGWIMRSTTGPHPRNYSKMIYDDGRQRCVVVGGGYGNTTFADSWEWTGSEWILREAPMAPPRAYHALAYDRFRRHTLVNGGVRIEDPVRLDHTARFLVKGDADGDFDVDFSDLNRVLGSFGCSAGNCQVDYDADGDCDFVDLNLVLSEFGSQCP